MKRILALALAIGMTTGSAYAGNTVSVPMSASVGSQLELAGVIFEGDIADGIQVTNMNFGTLTDQGGTLAASKYFNVLLTANSSSRKYTIKQTAAALTATGGATLSPTTCIVTPHANGATLPAGSALGARGSFVATDKVIYASENAGSMQSVAAAYAVTNQTAFGASAPFIPLDQAGGTYNSSVTFTLTLV